MLELSYVLITDGSSDRALIPILDWLLEQHLPDWAIDGNWVDPYQLPNRPENPSALLQWQIKQSLDLYDQSNILFIHRDAEAQPRQFRVDEIQTALDDLSFTALPVCVIPVRMFEAWLLFDKNAIRWAAGNPNGRVALTLPTLRQVESLSDPKEVLYDLLKRASELTGRRLKKFQPQQAVHRLADLIDDYTTLRALPAFQLLEEDIEILIADQGW